MNFLLSIIPTLIVLGILIIIHEFGHFIACRLCKVKVEKFSVGFGPEIIHWQGKETRYAISLFPLGGFVKPAGESVGELQDSAPRPGDYLAAPVLSRIIIVTAGVVMNYVLAFVIFVVIFMMGRPVPGTTIGGFVEGYPAAVSGLAEGDTILQINEKPVASWMDLTETLEALPDGPIALIVERKNELGQIAPVALSVVPQTEEVKDLFGEVHRVKRLGITPHPESRQFERYGFVKALGMSWQTEKYLTVMTHKAIFYLITGRLSVKSISGPIGIISMTGDAAKLGFPYLLQLTATLSVSLAVINLLPIPALDGGHLFFLLIEAIRRKQLSLVVQERATQVGFMLLMALMVFILYNDLVNLDVFAKIKGFFSG